MVNWREDYKSKQVSAEEAVKAVKSGGPGNYPHIGALLSQEGRAITVLPSTTVGGSISCLDLT